MGLSMRKPIMYPNPAAGFGWTNQVPPPYDSLGGASNAPNRQIGFCLDPSMTPVPTVEVAPVSHTPGLFGFDLSNIGPSPNAPPAYPGDSFRAPAPTPAVDHSYSNHPANIPNTNVQVTVTPARPSVPPMGTNSYPESPSNSTPSRTQSERTIRVSPARKPDNPTPNNKKDDDDTDVNERRRRSSYQESLKNMAELMTDVQLTDDILNDLRVRFDLNK